jgi:hypothetical protein
MFSAYHEYGKHPRLCHVVPNMFCIENCKEYYDHLKLASKPIFQKINTLYEKASIEVEGKHFDLDILMGGDMKFLQLVLEEEDQVHQ